MGRHIKWRVAGIIAAMYLVTGCNPMTHQNTNQPLSDATPKHSTGQVQPRSDEAGTSNSTNQPSANVVPEGYVPFQLTSDQQDLLRQALMNINVQDVEQMAFYGAKVYVPQWVPENAALTSVFSGGQAGYPMYVTFTFHTFTLTLLNQSPVFTDMTKAGTTTINGQPATWYTRASGQSNLSFLEYQVDGTFVSFTSSLQGITKVQLESIAKSLVPLKKG